MKRILFLALLLANQAFAERWPLPPGTGVAIRRDFSSTSVGSSYGSSGNAVAGFTSLTGKSYISCTSTAGTDLIFSMTTSVATCTGGSDNFFVPAAPSGGIGFNTVENITINGNVCVRSASGTANSGILNCIIK